MNKKIYILENDAITLAGLESQLSSQGMLVRSCSGMGGMSEMIYNIKLFSPDYLIMDLLVPNIEMPSVNGVEVLHTIKSDSDIYNIPIFLFTDQSDQEVIMRCRDMGVEYFYDKNSLNIDEFINRFKKTVINREQIK